MRSSKSWICCDDAVCPMRMEMFSAMVAYFLEYAMQCICSWRDASDQQAQSNQAWYLLAAICQLFSRNCVKFDNTSAASILLPFFTDTLTFRFTQHIIASRIYEQITPLRFTSSFSKDSLQQVRSVCPHFLSSFLCPLRQQYPLNAVNILTFSIRMCSLVTTCSSSLSIRRSKHICNFYNSSLAKQCLKNRSISCFKSIPSSLWKSKLSTITRQASASLYPSSADLVLQISTIPFNFSPTVPAKSSLIIGASCFLLLGSLVKLFLNLTKWLCSFIMIKYMYDQMRRDNLMKKLRDLVSVKMRSTCGGSGKAS